MLFDNLAHERQTRSCARISIVRWIVGTLVQSAKDAESFIVVFLVNPNAIVAEEDGILEEVPPHLDPWKKPDFDDLFILVIVLDPVNAKILQNRLHLNPLGLQSRNCTNLENFAATL